MSVYFKNSRLLLFNGNAYSKFQVMQRRFKYKQKWASNEPTTRNVEKALNHFDLFYKPVYQDKWPSIRIALLSQQKYCALVNNYSITTEVENFMQRNGAHNMMQKAADRMNLLQQLDVNDPITMVKDPDKTVDDKIVNNIDRSTQDKKIEDEHDEDSLPTFIHFEKNTSLQNFVPAKKVFTVKELRLNEENKASTYEERQSDIPIRTMQERFVNIPENLRVYTYEKGEVKDFPPPKSSTNYLDYFLMDAASILPVIALDLQPEESVLDLCACPGGKTLTMLQLHTPEMYVCNDVSKSRMGRLHRILRAYVPDSVQVQTVVKDGRTFSDPDFNKVLVDVPCNTDRHNLVQDDNNLFNSHRADERLKLPILQKDLLVAGIKSCMKGGSIVYSTCTLSPAQNDGVVQAALEEIWRETDIDVTVVELSYFSEVFCDTFNFHKSRFGQLIIPSLSANFGPMYICKLKVL